MTNKNIDTQDLIVSKMERNRKRGLSWAVLYSCQDRSISWIVQIDGVTIKSLQHADAGRKRNVRFVINGPRHYSHTNVKCILLFAKDIFLLQISSAPKHSLIISG